MHSLNTPALPATAIAGTPFERAKSFAEQQSGSIAAVFALSLVPAIFAMGSAVDYGRASGLRVSVQNAIDTAALNIAAEGIAATNSSRASTITKALMDANPIIKASNATVSVQSAWLTPTDFRVRAQVSIPTAFLKAIPTAPKTLPISSEVIVRVYEAFSVAQAPEISQLDPEAGDYNRIGMYCYNPTKRDDPTTKGRTQFVNIADNGGTVFTFVPPICGPNETLSYNLYNVRGARSNPSAWNAAGSEKYNYYSDTTLQQYTQTFNFGGQEILETVLCDNITACRPQSLGGVIPQGKERNPRTETRACEPGKFMYYGWEDRPPGSGWTDRDYDDIRVIVACPVITRGLKEVRLLK